MLPFKKGAFHMAVQAGVPVVPMAFKNSDNLMPRGRAEAWPGTIEMVMLPPVETSWVSTDEDLRKLVDQVQHMIMKELGVTKLSKRPPKPTQP
jgi:1-acyl-sn-glycerol-3-phosphate acyltransferase